DTVWKCYLIHVVVIVRDKYACNKRGEDQLNGVQFKRIDKYRSEMLDPIDDEILPPIGLDQRGYYKHAGRHSDKDPPVQGQFFHVRKFRLFFLLNQTPGLVSEQAVRFHSNHMHFPG